MYTGVKVAQVGHDDIDQLYKVGKLPIAGLEGTELPPYPNMSVVLKCNTCQSHSALTTIRDDGKTLRLLPKDAHLDKLTPKNKEQRMLVDRLMDEDVPMSIAIGHAGTGKTYCASAVGLHKVLDRGVYDSLILTKPMSVVGGSELGAMPGALREKFDPYLLSFFCNFEQLVGESGIDYLYALEERGVIRAIPVSIMRGASFSNSFIIADEVQSFSPHELKTLCTRVGEGSKLVLMGDPSQIDSRLKWEDTGLFKLIHDMRIKTSPLTSYIELVKGCRSALADLVADVL